MKIKNQIPAIETEYRGVLFRSRLEAKWASFFDLVGWPWQYEPLDLKGYIPDFILTMPKGPIIVEVKPELYLEELIQYAPKIQDSGWKHESLIVGTGPFNIQTGRASLGMLDERGKGYPDADPDAHWWSNAVFHKCTNCGHYSFHHEEGMFFCRHSGCYEGDHYLGIIDFDEAFRLFAVASQQARWNP